MRNLQRLIRWMSPLLLLFVASALAAQEATPAAVSRAGGPSVGPTFENASLGYRADGATGLEMTWDSQRRSSRSNGRILAIVGGAAFIGGLLIEGDAGTAIAVGGLVVGLIGLYQWLK